MSNNINWGKIYESTAWGSGVTDNNISWGKSYADLAGGGGFDADYQAVLDQASSLGYTAPSAAQQTLQNTLVTDLKTAGVWSKLDVFYVFATDGDSDYATLNWKTPSSHQITKVNSPTFTTDIGFRGNASSSYLNTNYAPSTDAVNYELNNASMFMYRSELPTAGQIQAYEGTFKSGEGYAMISGRTGPYGENYLNSTAGLANDNTNVGVGLQLVNRPNSNTINLYFNGSFVSQNTSAASTSVPSVSVWNFAANNGASGIFFSNVGHGMWGMGADLTSEQADLNTAIQNYISAL